MDDSGCKSWAIKSPECINGSFLVLSIAFLFSKVQLPLGSTVLMKSLKPNTAVDFWIQDREL